MATRREILGAVTIAPVVYRLQTLMELRVHSLLRTNLCRMAVQLLWRTSIKAPANLLDQRLQRGGKRVSKTVPVLTLKIFGARNL
jgi:hypothetical protein